MNHCVVGCGIVVNRSCDDISVVQLRKRLRSIDQSGSDCRDVFNDKSMFFFFLVVLVWIIRAAE